MEDTIRDLAIYSFQNKFDYIRDFIPENVEIHSIGHVVNYYKNDMIIDSTVIPPLGK